MADGDDFLDFDPPRQCMQLLAAGEQKHRDHRYRHRDPGRQRQSHRAKDISVNVENRHDDADIRLALLVGSPDIGPVIDDEPHAENEKAAGERNESARIEQIKNAARKREHRKGADAAGSPLRRLREEIFKREPEEETQAQKQRNAGR
ncbi:MAG: hypothetical protein WAV38_15665 [Xanthobacteraceae bacterium]